MRKNHESEDWKKDTKQQNTESESNRKSAKIRVRCIDAKPEQEAAGTD